MTGYWKHFEIESRGFPHGFLLASEESGGNPRIHPRFLVRISRRIELLLSLKGMWIKQNFGEGARGEAKNSLWKFKMLFRHSE